MKYVLDTNAVAALMRGDAPVVARLAAAGPGTAGLPQPVLAEIAYGIRRLPASRRKEALRGRFELIASELPHLSWDDGVSERFAEAKTVLERKGRIIEDFDLAIAAHALALGAVLVTANVSHFARIPGLEVEDWSRGVP